MDTRVCQVCRKRVFESQWWGDPYNVCVDCIKNNREKALNEGKRGRSNATPLSFKKISCIDCGKTIITTSNNTKRCNICKKSAKKGYRDKYKMKKNGNN